MSQTEWVLILSIIAREGGCAINHIDGFSSKSQADAAGAAWKSEMMKNGGGQFEAISIQRPG